MEPGDVFVCAVGADEQGERLVRCARRLARIAGLRPLLVHVIEPAAQDPLDVWEARSMLRHAGASAREMRVETGETAPALARVARQEGAALIVVASRGFGPLKAALLGSVSHALMTDAPVPVMILPPEVEPWFNTDRVLCGVDPDPGGSPSAGPSA